MLKVHTRKFLYTGHIYEKVLIDLYISNIYMRRFSYTLHKYIKVCKRTFPMWVKGLSWESQLCGWYK